jgi:hypothetical protein
MRQKLLDKQTEVKALRLLRSAETASKSFRAIFEKVRKNTIDFVTSHPEIKRKLDGKRYQVVGADLKPVRHEFTKRLPQRIAEVGIYDYETNTLLVQEVDLKNSSLLEAHYRKGIQPPLNQNELAEVRKLALGHRSYAKLASVKGLQMVTSPARVSFLPGHLAEGHRVFTVYFWSGGKNPKRRAEALVDLSESKLLGKEDFDDAVMEKLHQRAANEKQHENGGN